MNVPEVLAASIIKAMMMEATSTSETSVSFYQTAWHNIPKDSHLHYYSNIHMGSPRKTTETSVWIVSAMTAT
jgi:hypothetical protein